MSSQGPSHPPPPPPSEGSHTNLNTAPQSFLNPFKASGGARRGHDPLKPPTAAERATYLRRITRPDLPEPKPTRFQRGMGVLAVVSSVAAGIYMTFFMDWHRDQHAFKELRQWAGTEKYQVDLWPMKRDEWYKQTGFTKEELIKMVGEEELEKAAPLPSGAGTRRKKIGIEDIRRQQAAAGAGAGAKENQTVPHQPPPSQSSTTTTPILDSVRGTIWTREKAP